MTAQTQSCHMLPELGVRSAACVLCVGQIVEDIDFYGRLHEQFHMMKPEEKRENDAIEGFGDTAAVPVRLEKVVCFKPMSGLLSQDKYLPIRYCP